MGSLEGCVDILRLSGPVDYTPPGVFAWGLYLVAMVFLVLSLKKPSKKDRLP